MSVRLLIGMLAVCIAACGGSRGGDGGVYLALGDSIAVGSGASDDELTDYVALVAVALRGGIEARTLAGGGHTTEDLIDSQLDDAEAALAEGDVRLVTITVGGNDLNVLINDPANAAACIQDVEEPPCPVPEVLVGTEERLDTILRQLREAGPETTMVIQVYPNLYSGTGNPFEGPAEDAFGLLNDVIEQLAERHGVLIADPRDGFVGRGGELTHVLEEPPDSHPNDAGYRVIADAFLEALGLD